MNDCIDIRRCETITGFFVRAGFWIDGIQILTSLGRRSPMYGNPHGGSAYVLVLCPFQIRLIVLTFQQAYAYTPTRLYHLRRNRILRCLGRRLLGDYC